MRAAAPPALVAALVVATTFAGGCASVEPPPGTIAAPNAGDACTRAFAACAPPVNYRPETDVAALDLRRLVHLACRIDVGSLSARAAKRLLQIAREASQPVLLEIEDALEDSDAVLAKCGCAQVKPDVDKVGVREVVRSRVPPRDLRTPATWTERIVTPLAAIRELTRRSATGAAGGHVGGTEEADASLQAAERDVCEAVHGARAALPAESFERMLEAVYLRRETDAGAGSAESARRTVAAYARSASCESARAPAAN